MNYDPVCHKKINIEKTKFKITYQRKIYYFCSDKCLKEFEKEPKKYYWADVRKVKIPKEEKDDSKKKV